MARWVRQQPGNDGRWRPPRSAVSSHSAAALVVCVVETRCHHLAHDLGRRERTELTRYRTGQRLADEGQSIGNVTDSDAHETLRREAECDKVPIPDATGDRHDLSCFSSASS